MIKNRELLPRTVRKSLTLTLGAAVMFSPSVHWLGQKTPSEQSSGVSAGFEGNQEEQSSTIDDQQPRVNDLDMTVLVVDSGEARDQSPLDNQEITQTFEDATQIMRDSTDGEVDIRLTSTDNVTIPSTGSSTSDEGEVRPCYLKEDIEHFFNNYRRDNNLDKFDTVAFVLNSTPDCEYYRKKGPQTAVAMIYDKPDFPAYTKYSIYSKNTIIHEQSHVVGLSHEAIFDCTYFDIENKRRDEQPAVFDDIKGQVDRGCGPRKHRDGKVDKTSSPYSTMGHVHSTEHYERGSVYPYIELNKLAPKRFNIERVNPEVRAKYELSMESDGIVGVAIPLPDSHPLSTVDKGIKEISFGLVPDVYATEDKPGMPPSYIVMPMAYGDGQTYLLDTMDLGENQSNIDRPGWLCSFESGDDHIEAPIIYADKAMDIVVTARRCDGKYFVEIDSFENTKHKRQQTEATVNQMNSKVGKVLKGINKIALSKQNS